jgi:hypothetical protein
MVCDEPRSGYLRCLSCRELQLGFEHKVFNHFGGAPSVCRQQRAGHWAGRRVAGVRSLDMMGHLGPLGQRPTTFNGVSKGRSFVGRGGVRGVASA